jgi:hypothetical protein
VNEKMGYGTPSDGIFARLPKKMVNTTIVKSGWITAQEAPKIVCLYLTLISRHAKKYKSSRCSHSSLKSGKDQPRDGLMIIAEDHHRSDETCANQGERNILAFLE